MSRRSEWREVRKAIVGGKGSVGKTVEEREKMPEKACGLCKNFSENAKEADGRGTCGILKMGSDLRADPPKLVTEGEIGLITFINTDGGKCRYFTKMALIDKDLGETADPSFRRAHRQMEKV
jgi:hypothetical protein